MRHPPSFRDDIHGYPDELTTLRYVYSECRYISKLLGMDMCGARYRRGWHRRILPPVVHGPLAWLAACACGITNASRAR